MTRYVIQLKNIKIINLYVKIIFQNTHLLKYLNTYKKKSLILVNKLKI